MNARPARRLHRLPRSVELGHAVPVARRFRARLLGLALLSRERAGPGLLIPRCSSIHTWGMRFELDIYFLDADGVVIEVRRSVAQRRIVACAGVAAVLEVPAGTRIPRRLTPGSPGTGPHIPAIRPEGVS